MLSSLRKCSSTSEHFFFCSGSMVTCERTGEQAALSSFFTHRRRIAGQGRENRQENTMDAFPIAADARRTPQSRRKSWRGAMHELVPAWRVGNGLAERASSE